MANPLNDIETMIGQSHELASVVFSVVNALIGPFPASCKEGPDSPSMGRINELACSASAATDRINQAITEMRRLRETLLPDDAMQMSSRADNLQAARKVAAPGGVALGPEAYYRG